ncbi:hydrolase TatD [bacterium]|nr:hydrolase TatD [bacterium]|tara:strand:+ start:3115 stop:3945 length:831 start_codon:yes stop_codon:yes gene_type:complete
MPYIDAHTHVNFAAFSKDYKEVIDRALKHDVFLVNVGTQQDTSKRAVEIADEYKEGVYAVVGMHPIHSDSSHHDAEELGGDIGFTSRGEEFDKDFYLEFAKHDKVVAIGECGLDYFRIKGDEQKERQKKVFVEHIKLAKEAGKPLMIHCREAFSDLLDILESHRGILNNPSGIAHFFSGTKEDAKKLLDLGFYFTFGGVITFVRDYDEVVQMIPADRILSETDAPYVSPEPYRKDRNEPVYVIEVVKKLAEIRGVSEEEMKEQIWNNAKTVFGIDN